MQQWPSLIVLNLQYRWINYIGHPKSESLGCPPRTSTFWLYIYIYNHSEWTQWLFYDDAFLYDAVDEQLQLPVTEEDFIRSALNSSNDTGDFWSKKPVGFHTGIFQGWPGTSDAVMHLHIMLCCRMAFKRHIFPAKNSQMSWVTGDGVISIELEW